MKNECGLSGNPLKISWLEGQPEVIAPVPQPGQFMSSQVPCNTQTHRRNPPLPHKACRLYSMSQSTPLAAHTLQPKHRLTKRGM